ncbi:MAG: hypothetical protein COB30_014840, partial [Ectothiorhodospiraceae bacterium]|nr:hypothetical protein [Ectothiorhodospiraceae bacterium]
MPGSPHSQQLSPDQMPAHKLGLQMQRLVLALSFGLLVACGGGSGGETTGDNAGGGGIEDTSSTGGKTDSGGTGDTGGAGDPGETGGTGDTGSTGDTGGTGGAGDTGGTDGGSTALTITSSIPLRYQWGTLAIGSTVYSDRTYTFSSVPAAYLGVQH